MAPKTFPHREETAGLKPQDQAMGPCRKRLAPQLCYACLEPVLVNWSLLNVKTAQNRRFPHHSILPISQFLSSSMSPPRWNSSPSCETRLFSPLFLCLSRACLDQMIVLSINVAPKRRLPHLEHSTDVMLCKELDVGPCGKQTPLFSAFPNVCPEPVLVKWSL